MTTKERPTFWKRVGSAFRIRRRRAKDVHRLPDVGEDGLLAEPAAHPSDGDGESAPDKPGLSLPRWTKRDQTLAKLQEGYEQVTQVVEKIGGHLVTQEKHSERICDSLEQLARAMSDVPNISRQQAQTLDAIAGQLENTNARTQQLAETMSEIPKVARSQTETLNGITRHLEMSGEQNVVTTQTLDKLGTTISVLGESNHAQSEVLQQMDAKTAEQNQMLTSLIARQSRRFMMLFIVTVLLAAAAVVIGILSLNPRGG